MIDFFDDNNEVFIKLHKNTNDHILYWETWNLDEKNATIHWGKLGNTGDKEEVNAKDNQTLKKIINERLNQKIEAGFVDIPFEAYHLLILTFEMESLGDEAEDLERKEALRDLVTEVLGWTGNGNCDDGEVRDDNTILYADVLKPDIAVQSLKEAFKAENMTGEFFVTVMKEEEILVENKKVTLR